MSGFDPTLEPLSKEGRRFEVINGALGRRRWSAEAKGRIVAESLRPGAVISEVARRHELRPQQLFAWRRQARDGGLVVPLDGQTSFAPVMLDEMEAEAAALPLAVNHVELVVGEVTVRLPLDIAPRRLAAIVQALRVGS